MSIWLSYHSVDDDFDASNEAWDCDPSFVSDYESEYDDLDEDNYPFEDWQVIALDRFGDRRVNERY